MKTALPILCILALSGAPAFGLSNQNDTATAFQWPALPNIGSTERMDPEVVQVLEQHQQAVLEAQKAGTDEAARGAAGNAYAELGLAYEANTMWHPAVACYQSAWDLIPGEGSQRDQWLYRKGACQHATGDAMGAMTTLADVSPRLSGTALVHARLAQACFDVGDMQKARDAWQFAIDAERIAWEKADPATRSEAPIPLPASRVGMAQVLLELDKPIEAEALLVEALTLQPQYPHAHYLIGLAQAEQGRDDEAEFSLSRGLNAYPVMPPDPHAQRLAAKRAGYGNRMRNIEMAMQGGQIAQAIADLEDVLTTRPNDFLVLNLLARSYRAAGNPAKALELLLRSETIDPTQHHTKVQLAIEYLNQAGQIQDPVQRGQYMEQAKAKTEEAIRIAPYMGTPYYYRGVLELSTVNPQDPSAGQIMQNAMSLFQRAHMLGCQEPQLLEQMASLYAQMGRIPQMVTFAKHGTKRSPENPSAWMFLARAQLTAKNFEEAQKASERALLVSNNNPQVQDFVNRLGQAIEQESKQ